VFRKVVQKLRWGKGC